MRVKTCDIFREAPDAICIPTNGKVYPYSVAQFSRKGIGRAAIQRWPGIEFLIADRIRKSGHRVYLLTSHDTKHPMLQMVALKGSNRKALVGKHWVPISVDIPVPYHILTFPVRHGTINKKISLSLIRRSCLQLMEGIVKMGWTEVMLAVPELYENDLPLWPKALSILKNLLDERVVLVESPDADRP